MLTENGPFLWQAGTLAPTPNPYAWNKVTNVVWVEQPVGTGYSQGQPNITNELELAQEFMGFWRNFIDTFEIQGRKTYLTGESYAGFYVPYIGNAFLEANDTDYFDLQGIAINDPIIGSDIVQQEADVVPYIDYWANLFDLNATFVEQVRSQADTCGYTEFFNNVLQFPPQQEPFPDTFNGSDPACDVFSTVYEAVLEVNPCFNIYHITDTCKFEVLTQ